MKKLGLAVLLSALGVFAFAGISTGSGSDQKRPLDATANVLPVHQVKQPSGTSATLSRVRFVRNVRTAYYETSPFAVPPNGRAELTVQCPSGWKVVSGYFDTNGGIVPDGFAVRSNRSMYFSLIDLTGLEGQAYVGLVCQKVIR